jgi:hypothetical protein
MTMPFHIKPLEKTIFEEVIFLLKYHQNPQVLKRWSIEKKKEKEKEKKLQESPQIKGEVNILKGEKHFNFKDLFYVISFSPPPSYHFKNTFQNH